VRGAAATVAALVLAGLSARAAAAPPPGDGVLPAPAPGFAQALTPRTFSFPADHGPHPEFRQEWWYLTGNLDTQAHERVGFELTFFRFALAPATTRSSAASSAWRAREIYLAHFAITDVARGQFVAQQKLARAALGLSGAQSEPLRIWIDDWSLGVERRLPWQLHASQPGYQLDLELIPQGAPVLNGVAGLSRKADEAQASSYYYSIPHLAVRGRLLRANQVQSVAGSAWLDREWGSGALGAQQRGWDWFGLQLSDGSALMFYALRLRDGGRDAHSAGTFIAPDGAARALASAEVAITATAAWRSPRGDRYPAAWRIAVRALGLDLSVQPVLAAQELDTTPRYWEGAVDVAGTRNGTTLGGRGYVELVGYAQERGPGREAGAAAALSR
jgi:predicted secreted hydrolase